MADMDAARDALYDAIEKAAGSPQDTRGIADLAEAWAWLTTPDQPHGGSVSVSQ